MKELVPTDDPVEGLGDFFDLLWETQEGYVYLPNKNPKTEEWQKVMFSWPEERPRVIEYTLAMSARGRDVYCAPTIFRERSPKKESVLGTYFCWVDFDGNAPESWPGTTPGEGQEQGLEALNRLDGTAPPPTLRICSSRKGHEHVYWRFNEFVKDVSFIEDTNRALAYKYKADTSGWDVGQVLRPPGTTNYKHDLEVKVESSTERAYSREDFAGFKKVKELVTDSIELGDLPAVEKIISKYVWDDHNFELFMKPEIEEGKRSSALMAIGFFGAEKGMTNEEIYALLINADDRWGKFKRRSDREKRLLDIVNKARQKHPVALESDANFLRGMLGSDDDVEQAPRIVYGFDEFNKLEIEIEWIIEGLLEKEGMALVTSPPGVGKTQISLQFAICCALGEDFITFPVQRKFKVMWFSLEMAAPALQFFTQKMASDHTDADLQQLNRNLYIVPMGEVLPLDHAEGKKFFEALLEEYKPDIVVLDSMGKVTNESLSDEKKAKELNSYYAKVKKKYGLALWFIHHTRKANGDNKKPKELADIYGNQYISADITSAFSLWPTEKGLEFSAVKTRLAQTPPTLTLQRNSETLKFTAVQEILAAMADSPLLREKEENGDDSPGGLPDVPKGLLDF